MPTNSNAKQINARTLLSDSNADAVKDEEWKCYAVAVKPMPIYAKLQQCDAEKREERCWC